MKYPDKRLMRPRHYPHNLAFLTAAFNLVPCNIDFNCISVQSSSCLSSFYKNIIFLTLHNHEDIALASHLYPSYLLKEDFFLSIVTIVPAMPTISVVSSVSSVHNNCYFILRTKSLSL